MNCTLDYRGRARPMRGLCYLGWSCTSGNESSQLTPTEKRSLKTNGQHTTRQDETSLFFNSTKNYEEWCFHSKRWQLSWKGGVAVLDWRVCVLMSRSPAQQWKILWHCCLSFVLASWLIIQRFGAENNGFPLQGKVKEQILYTKVSNKIDFILVNMKTNKSYL